MVEVATPTCFTPAPTAFKSTKSATPTATPDCAALTRMGAVASLFPHRTAIAAATAAFDNRETNNVNKYLF